jgi:hypothetical protein
MAEILIGNIKGDKGETGSGLKILGYYATLSSLESAVANPNVGDAYGVGSAAPYNIYIYTSDNGWVDNGQLQGAKGDSAKITEVTANVDNTSGTPDVAVTMGGTDTNRTFHLSFSGLKGEKGEEPTEHINDTTKHITSEERTAWNNKAPSGHGLGEYTPTFITDIINLIPKGNGFYSTGDSTDSPKGTGEWLGILQTVRTPTAGKETGTQMVFYDFAPNKPQMWLRTMASGNVGSWVEMLHTGNLSSHNVARIEKLSYTGNGLYGFENARTFTFSFQPKMFYISGYGRGGGNYTLTVPYGFPFAHTVVHTSDGGFAAMNCEFQYSGNSITMYNTTSANNGFNTDGKPYTIVAIG